MNRFQKVNNKMSKHNITNEEEIDIKCSPIEENVPEENIQIIKK